MLTGMLTIAVRLADRMTSPLSRTLRPAPTDTLLASQNRPCRSETAAWSDSDESVQLSTISLIVPVGAEPGQIVSTTHEGQDVTIEIPQDAEVGDTISVKVELAMPTVELNSSVSPPPPSAPPTTLAQLPAPVINVHGRRLGRTWSLLARTAPETGNKLALKDDPIAMGWRVGDAIGIATTSGREGTRAVITHIGGAAEYSLERASVEASSSNRWLPAEWAVDDKDDTQWSADGSDPQWLLMRLKTQSVLTRVQILWK